MPYLAVTTDRLNVANEEMNLADLVPICAGDEWDYLVESELDMFSECYADDLKAWEGRTGKKWEDEISFDIATAAEHLHTNAVDFVNNLIFGADLSEVVEIVANEKASPSINSDRDYLPVLVTVKDPDALMTAYVDANGHTLISDGREPGSGFYRTCSVERWVTANVLGFLLGEHLLETENSFSEYVQGYGSPDDLGICYGDLDI